MIAPELLPLSRQPRLTSRKPTRSMTASNRNYEYHESVLLAEVVRFLAPAPGRTIVDGTLGGGGHSAALLADRKSVV